MRIAILLLLIQAATAAPAYIDLPIGHVYDGDTIKFNAPWAGMPQELAEGMSVRVYGIDTPEMPAKSYHKTGKLGRAKCSAEAELALTARAAVRALTGETTVMRVRVRGWDKFGGRISGDVEIGGTDVAKMLIDRGLAVPYYGEKKTKNWCKK